MIACAVSAFALRKWPFLVSALGLQVVLWFVVGYAPGRLVRQITKLWGFALFVIGSYALTSEAPEIDRWVHLRVAQVDLKLNIGQQRIELCLGGHAQ